MKLNKRQKRKSQKRWIDMNIKIDLYKKSIEEYERQLYEYEPCYCIRCGGNENECKDK